MRKMLFPLTVLLLAVSCLPVLPSTPIPLGEPPIAYIDSLSATTITEGQTVSFVGHATDANGTVVAYSWRSDQDGMLSTSPSFSTSTLKAGTHYIYFKVQNNRGAWSNEPYRIVNVLPVGVIKPFVRSFKAVPAVIFEGESTTLAWDVSDAITVTISPDIGNLPGTGSRLVSPKTTTTYTITVTNKAGSVTEEVKVTVTTVTKKTIELFSIAEEEGYVSRNGDIGLEPQAGITVSGVPMQAFFSFDISMIPPGATILSASLDLTTYIPYGYPHGVLGAFGVFNDQYGSLKSRDYKFAFTLDALVLAYTLPTKPYDTAQLAEAVQKQVDVRNPRFQTRAQFEKFTFFPGQGANYLEFVKGKTKLIIYYN